MDGVPRAFPQCSQKVPWSIPGEFPERSHIIPRAFPQCSHSVLTAFPEHSQKVPGEFLEGSWSAPRAFPICSQSIPRVFPGVFPQRSCNIPRTFPERSLECSHSVPGAFPEPSWSLAGPPIPHHALISGMKRLCTWTAVHSSPPLLPSHHSFLSSRPATPLPPQLSRTSRQFAASPASKRGCSIVCTCRCTSHPFSDIKAFW